MFTSKGLRKGLKRPEFSRLVSDVSPGELSLVEVPRAAYLDLADFLHMKEARLKSQSASNPAIISLWLTKLSEIRGLLEAQWWSIVAQEEVQQA